MMNLQVFFADWSLSLMIINDDDPHASFSDFQNMPNAMRPSAPRPQTFNAIRPTATANTQVPRMMASQRMRKWI